MLSVARIDMGKSKIDKEVVEKVRSMTVTIKTATQMIGL